jgi:hypothetical protein
MTNPGRVGVPRGTAHATFGYGTVVVDPPLTTDPAKALGDWIEASGKRLTTYSPPMVTAIIGVFPTCWPSGSARD